MPLLISGLEVHHYQKAEPIQLLLHIVLDLAVHPPAVLDLIRHLLIAHLLSYPLETYLQIAFLFHHYQFKLELLH